jgi:flagellar biosynthesis/type III secretory pathway protein FliH
VAQLLSHPFMTLGAQASSTGPVEQPIESTLRFPRRFKVDWLQCDASTAEDTRLAVSTDGRERPIPQSERRAINPFSRTAMKLNQEREELKEKLRQELMKEAEEKAQQQVETFAQEMKKVQLQLEQYRQKVEEYQLQVGEVPASSPAPHHAPEDIQ